ncbi:cytochrome c biogenesis CcdA family protein [Bacillus thermotolerans]|uniref:Cytochrome c-type biogenesis protein CcdA n=1 Tax=Bacillus thermotolerans TaxID=1221996 RepID=A0A0F5HSH6_BACTR|nr:cytochrome c biogenesis protein CcdA [Bacillus thermotolerans]KKB33541.1 Cytochrome c-type biogenesis protein CcdA [Bacillus thermotolerans]KKB34038.1 Cytochrome c-type biogenesis protein CcdA [Bacillus thermotolerans]KKB35802.1 Cytochrome c-type biogenesis protein CcdA [Bacillus thermotolerans]
MNDISIFFALIGGVLSFFSPCVFPLLPAYITHLTGGKIENAKMQVNRTKLYSRSIGFIIGFSLVFIALGASASFIGQILMDYRVLVMQLAGLLIIIFGLQMAGLLNFKFFMKEKRIQAEYPSKNIFGSVLLGMAFASGWSPCVGLALSSILLLASSSDTLGQGVFLLGAYSLGMAVPFFIITIVISYSLKTMRKINKYLSKLAFLNGIIMVGLGFLVLSGQLQKISAWLSAYSLFSL